MDRKTNIIPSKAGHTHMPDFYQPTVDIFKLFILRDGWALGQDVEKQTVHLLKSISSGLTSWVAQLPRPRVRMSKEGPTCISRRQPPGCETPLCGVRRSHREMLFWHQGAVNVSEWPSWVLPGLWVLMNEKQASSWMEFVSNGTIM